MPAVALSRVGARVIESGRGGQDLAAGAWQRLEALVACQNSCRASDLDFYPQRSCSFASSISS